MLPESQIPIKNLAFCTFTGLTLTYLLRVDISFVCVNQDSARDLFHEFLVRPSVILGQLPFELTDNRGGDRQAKTISDAFCDVGKGLPMSHVLIHGPALQ